MKLLLIILLAIALTSHAKGPEGSATELLFTDSYCLIATTEFRAYLELRSDNDKLLDSVVLLSRYMPPTFEINDVVLDSQPEFIVYVREGGTGFEETHLKIFGVIQNHIRRLGDFVVEREFQTDEPIREGKLLGKVVFPKKDKLTYSYTEIITDHGKTTTNRVTQLFQFNPNKKCFEKNSARGKQKPN